jgi:glyoxylase I family protein
MTHIDALFAAVAVTDLDAAVAWYGRLFGRPPDVLVHEHEVMWRVADGGWLYVLVDAERAGHGLVTLAVSDLDGAVAALATRGVTAGPVEDVGDAGRKAQLVDPCGNSVSLIHVV